MFCSKCGKEMVEGTKFCPSCGAPTENLETSASQQTGVGLTQHKTPRCNSCGNIGEWKVGPLLRPIDLVIGVVLLLFGVFPGIVYLGVVAAVRSNVDRREKICPKCGAKNMFSFLY